MNDLEEANYFFGYAKNKDNKYGFFDYEGKSSCEDKFE